MATQPKRDKATRPSRNKKAGGKGAPKKKAAPARTPTEDAPAERQGLPARAQRQGTRRIHSRELTGPEAKKRQEREAERRESEKASQAQHRDGLREKLAGRGRPRRGTPRGQ